MKGEVDNSKRKVLDESVKDGKRVMGDEASEREQDFDENERMVREVVRELEIRI